MNANKKIKPNLLDPIIEKKIVKTLNPQEEDYWGPTKNVFQLFYQNYIRDNIGLFIIIILIILFLIYRYRFVKKDREAKNIEHYINNTTDQQQHFLYQNQLNSFNQINSSNKLNDKYHLPEQLSGMTQTEPKSNTNIKSNDENETYAKILMAYYNQQKEMMREPKYKPSKLVYPMYPNSNGGTLIPSGKR